MGETTENEEFGRGRKKCTSARNLPHCRYHTKTLQNKSLPSALEPYCEEREIRETRENPEERGGGEREQSRWVAGDDITGSTALPHFALLIHTSGNDVGSVFVEI